MEDQFSVAIIGTRGYPSYYGGFETAIRKLAPFLAERGWDVTVYGRRGATTAADPLRDSRVTSRTTLGLEWKSLSTLSYGLSAALDARLRKPDVVLALNVANGYFLPMLRRARIPTLVNVDGIEWERAKWGRFARSVFQRGAKLTAENATGLVFDSHEIAARWKQDFNRGGTYIPYGGEPLTHRPGPVLGLEPRRYALVVARLVPENSIPEFIEAVPLIAKQYEVVIVGTSGYGGELDSAVRDLASRFERVRWLEHVCDDDLLMALWQNAGAYFHGHSVGGTNPSLVQAMACGAPIVARDTPFNREVLGPEGVFVQPAARAIADAISGLLENAELSKQCSERNKARAAENFTWPAVCSAYEAALRELVIANRGAADSGRGRLETSAKSDPASC